MYNSALHSHVRRAALLAFPRAAAASGTTSACAVQYGLVHISVGDLLREQVADGTEAGKKAKGFMDTGNLVPDEVVVDMVVDRLGQADVQRAGWLLDGYPRSASQAEAIEQRDIKPDVFLLVNVPDEVIVERVVGRRTDPETGAIYHLKFSPPPPEIEDRLVQARPAPAAWLCGTPLLLQVKAAAGWFVRMATL